MNDSLEKVDRIDWILASIYEIFIRLKAINLLEDVNICKQKVILLLLDIF